MKICTVSMNTVENCHLSTLSYGISPVFERKRNISTLFSIQYTLMKIGYKKKYLTGPSSMYPHDFSA